MESQKLDTYQILKNMMEMGVDPQSINLVNCGDIQNCLRILKLMLYLSNSKTMEDLEMDMISEPKNNCFEIEFPKNNNFIKLVISSTGDIGRPYMFKIAVSNTDGSLSTEYENLLCEADVHENIVSILENGGRCYVETDF